LRLEERELLEQPGDVGFIERILRLFDLVLEEHVAIRHALDVAKVKNRFHVLQVHRQPLETISNLARDGMAIEAPDLLEVGELGDLHPIQPHFPTEPPSSERGVLPIVLDESDVVLLEVETEGGERSEIQLKNVRRRGLEHHLKLMMLMEPVWIFAVATILRPARRLHVGCPPRFGAERAQEGRGVRGACPDFNIVGLQQGATLLAPVILERGNHLLKGQHSAKEAREGLDFTGWLARGATWPRRARRRRARTRALQPVRRQTARTRSSPYVRRSFLRECRA